MRSQGELWDGLYAALTDFEFLEAKCTYLGVIRAPEGERGGTYMAASTSCWMTTAGLWKGLLKNNRLQPEIFGFAGLPVFCSSEQIPHFIVLQKWDKMN